MMMMMMMMMVTYEMMMMMVTSAMVCQVSQSPGKGMPDHDDRG